MQIRRLVKAGQASHTVSLPKNWLDKNSLKKGDMVYIHENSDDEITIRPQMHKKAPEKKETTIEIDGKELDTIQREITSAYVNNCSTISIIGSELGEKTREIRKMLHDFVALEISEQTNKRIVAKDLLDLKEISIDKTIKRMDMIVRTMIEDTSSVIEGNEVHETIIFRDYDVNRLYFLLSRLLKNALKDSAMAEMIGIKKEEILSTWYLSTNLENLADSVKHICELIKKIDEKNLSSAKKIIQKLGQNYAEVMKAHHNKNKALADKIARERLSLVKDCAEIRTKTSQPELIELIENLKSISTTISNIARIVIDQE